MAATLDCSVADHIAATLDCSAAVHMEATTGCLACHYTAAEPAAAGHKRSAAQKDTAVETVAHMPAGSQGVERAAGQVVGMPTPLDRMT